MATQTTNVLSGSEVAAALNDQVSRAAAALKAKGVVPTLAVLRVGERGDDISYERGVTKRAEKVGVAVRSLVLPADVSETVLRETIDSLNQDSKVHGVLMFRPLPKHIDEAAACQALSPAKDIDGITNTSAAGIFAGSGSGFAPCTAEACIEILNYYGIDPKGKRATVVGRSLVVGKPVAMMLLDRHATVTIAHSRTVDLPSVIRGADIVIACIGRGRMIGLDCLRPGQVVIDVGINVTEDGSLVGDVDFGAASTTVSAITPVPGGVGTVTASINLRHVVLAAQRQSGHTV
jgi:methylenetetrahydrofolate dehydrogenase (NADP+)/methenyltetrahydrofolate cyclohydrolase